MKRFWIVLTLISLVLLNSCWPGHTPERTWGAKSVTLTIDPVTITTNQNLRLDAKIDFLKGEEGGPSNFSVRFLDGTKILAEDVVSNDETVTKDISVTKAMNGTLTVKARVFFTNTPDSFSIESQPVTVTINIP
jgi:hypothetical protein